MATSASVLLTPPVETADDTETWVLSTVVALPTLLIVVPAVVVGPLVTGPVVVMVADVVGEPKGTGLDGLGLGKLTQLFLSVVEAPEFVQVVKVFVLVAVVEDVAVTAGEVEVVGVAKEVVEINVPCTGPVSDATMPLITVTTRL
jgi:hypothetical protein